MGWEELIDALDELETEVEYDGYFCSIKDAVIIVTLRSMCELKSVMRIHSWATTKTVSKLLAVTKLQIAEQQQELKSKDAVI